MKTRIFYLLLAFFTVTGSTSQQASAQSVSFQVFYDDLSPYGSWVNNPTYGYVWSPDVDAGFSPYSSNGYWVFTDEGWTWMSDYSWGWAPFHYGRWFYEDGYGWLWAPDNEWGPGWVDWRSSDDYFGWSPMYPGANYGTNYDVPYNRWTFVRCGDFGRQNINNYYVSNSTNYMIINNTTVINNIREGRSNNVRYNAGPDRTQVERKAGRTFAPITISEYNTPGQHADKDHVQLYRPQVQKNYDNGRKPIPSRVVDIRDVKNPQQQQELRNDQQNKQQQQLQQQRNDQQNRQQQQFQQQRNKQQQQLQQQRNDQQNKQQQQLQRQRNDQQNKQQQQLQQQRNDQENKQQQLQQQRNDQQNKQQQQLQQQRNDQQNKQQQQLQQQRNNQQNKQPQQQPIRKDHPVKQGPPIQPQKNKDDKGGLTSLTYKPI